MLSRRDLMKLGLIGTGYVLMPPDQAFARFRDEPRSPATRPWRMPLPIPHAAIESPFPVGETLPDYIEGYRPARLTAATKFFEIVAEQRFVKYHPDLPQTAIWGYRPRNVPNWNFALGPTIVETFGLDDYPDISSGLLVRMFNQLPADHRGFGVTRTSMHLHGGHHPSGADGFPANLEGFAPFITERGTTFDQYYDHFFPTIDPGYLDYKNGVVEPPETTARQSSLWYHDHVIDFTAQNVYRGLAGFVVATDELDALDETNESTLQLPSGDYDVPMVLQDRIFSRSGALVYNAFDHDGFIGDKQIVNGAIQPYLDVKKRRYRFRFLNGANARIFQVFLTNDTGQRFPMTMVATEGGLLSRPLQIESFQMAPAERVEVVVDFYHPLLRNQKNLYFENRLIQEEGREPEELARRGYQLVQLRLGERPAEGDPSWVGKPNAQGEIVLRPFAPISQTELQHARRRTFEFGRRHGAWVVNDELAGHLEHPMATVRRGQGEIWRLVNKSGGWWHPIHIHSELFRVITRKGRTPPLIERDGIAKKDTILLRDNDEVEVFVKFRDYTGPFVLHCHNIEHEDVAMMARFDVVDEE